MHHPFELPKYTKISCYSYFIAIMNYIQKTVSDLLAFLNTADIDTLTRVPGISRTLAEELIAARPFEVVEDCLKVRGMGKNLLARIQSAFEERRIELKGRAMIPVEAAQEE